MVSWPPIFIVLCMLQNRGPYILIADAALHFHMFSLVYKTLNSCCKIRKSSGVFGGWIRKSVSPQAKCLCTVNWGSFILSQWNCACLLQQEAVSKHLPVVEAQLRVIHVFNHVTIFVRSGLSLVDWLFCAPECKILNHFIKGAGKKFRLTSQITRE